MTERWEAEEIPDDDYLYKFIKLMYFRDGEVLPACFTNVGQPDDPSYGMSTDWSRYTTLEETRMRPRDKKARYGVARIKAGEVAKVPDQYVRHDPIFVAVDSPENNRAHTNIKGPKNRDDGLHRPSREAIRLRFAALFDVIIEP